MNEPPGRYDVAVTVARDGEHFAGLAAFAVAAGQAAASRCAMGVMSARSAGQIITVVTVETSDWASAVAVALAVVPKRWDVSSCHPAIERTRCPLGDERGSHLPLVRLSPALVARFPASRPLAAARFLRFLRTYYASRLCLPGVHWAERGLVTVACWPISGTAARVTRPLPYCGALGAEVGLCAGELAA
jgi:hypothetical protein